MNRGAYDVTFALLDGQELQKNIMNKTDKKYSRKWWQEQFHEQANLPLVWKLFAAQLVYAAEVLGARGAYDWKRFGPTNKSIKKQIPPSLAATRLMLHGLAIENLAKGILVK